MKLLNIKTVSILLVFITNTLHSQDKKEKRKIDPVKKFKRLDKNNNGIISKEELEGKRILKRFAKIDANKSNGITFEEFTVFLEKRRQVKLRRAKKQTE